MRKRGAIVAILAIGAFVWASPGLAYEIDLATWNTIQIQPTATACTPLGVCDWVKVLIGTNTIQFTYEAGTAGSPGVVKDLLDLSWSFSVPASSSNSDSYSLQANTQTDGFNTANGYDFSNGVTYGNASNDKITDVTFTFASNVPLSLTANDFVAHVQYENACSGYVGGPGNGGVIGHSSNANCTPVPEPITMFLGGTGLLALGYAGRKTLFNRFLQ